MDLMLRGKTALIMSSSKGIGKGIALSLALEGCNLILTSSNQKNLEISKHEIQKESKVNVKIYVMDVTSSLKVDEAGKKIVEECHNIDIMVGNGPGPRPVSCLDMSVEQLRSAIQTNFISSVQLTKLVLPNMIEKKFGRIIYMTSTTAKEPDEGLVLSNSSRSGLLAYAKTLSREIAKHNITVNCILTGGVLSDRSNELIKHDARSQGRSYEKVLEQINALIPCGYIATPEVFSHVITFLCSPLAKYITGVAIPIDGGYMKSV
jgi:3-oxoacyl-[acyl-carrier protein] reductase